MSEQNIIEWKIDITDGIKRMVVKVSPKQFEEFENLFTSISKTMVENE